MYKAKLSFSGVVSMEQGEIKDIADIAIVKDLLKAGYIEEYKPAEKATTAKAKKKSPKKGG